MIINERFYFSRYAMKAIKEIPTVEASEKFEALRKMFGEHRVKKEEAVSWILANVPFSEQSRQLEELYRLWGSFRKTTGDDGMRVVDLLYDLYATYGNNESN